MVQDWSEICTDCSLTVSNIPSEISNEHDGSGLHVRCCTVSGHLAGGAMSASSEATVLGPTTAYDGDCLTDIRAIGAENYYRAT
jgi:hypothetical protein